MQIEHEAIYVTQNYVYSIILNGMCGHVIPNFKGPINTKPRPSACILIIR